MKLWSFAVCTCIFSTFALAGIAQEAETSKSSSATELSDNLACFVPYIGTWVIETEWGSGEKLWAKNQYEIGPGGNFVIAKTWARDGDGEPYQRYLTIFAWDKEKNTIVSHGFVYDGTVQQVDTEVEKSNGKELIRSQWQPNPSSEITIKQEVSIIDENQYGWMVWSRADDSAEFQPMMDGVWKRQTD